MIKLLTLITIIQFLTAQNQENSVIINEDTIEIESTYKLSSKQLNLYSKNQLFGTVLYKSVYKKKTLFLINFYQNSTKKGRCSVGEEHFISFLQYDSISTKLLKVQTVLFSSCLLQIETENLIVPLTPLIKNEKLTIKYFKEGSMNKIHFDPNQPEKGIY